MSNDLSDVGPAPEALLGQVVAIVRRHIVLVLVFAVIGAAIGAAVLAVTPKSYSVTATVKINVIATSPFDQPRSESGLVDGPTEVGIATSYVVASAVGEKIGMDAGETRAALTAVFMADATILKLSFVAPSLGAARQGADAAAAEYLDYRQQSADARIENAIKTINDQLDVLAKRLADLTTTAAEAAPGSAEAIRAESGRQQTQLEISGLTDRRNGFAQIDTSGGTVLTPAAQSVVTVSPSGKVLVAGGGAAGFLLGLMLVVPMDRANRRLRRAQDVGWLLGVPVLASLTSTTATAPPEGDDLAAYRIAREQLLGEISTLGVLAVIDEGTEEPADDVALGLAWVLAQERRDVEILLLGRSAELVPRVRVALGLDDGDAHEGGSVHTSSINPRLHVTTVEPGGWLDADEVLTEFARARIRGSGFERLVILAVPSGLPEASDRAVRRLADSAIEVVRLRRTRRRDLARSAGALLDAGVRVLGAVVLAPDRRLATTSTAGNHADRRPVSGAVAGQSTRH